MTGDKKIKIHIKNNHWAPGSFPTDAEGEKNFTITEQHLNEALKNYPEIKEKLQVFVDWDEENFEKSMSNSDILLAWNFPTENLKKISPNLKCFTPGIRQDKNENDQKRTMNAKQALEAGSDCLIIGRPITKGDPKKNIQEILSSLK